MTVLNIEKTPAIFKHDCDHCYLLEGQRTASVGKNKEPFLFDLYTCPASLSIVMRYGDEGHEYYSYSIDIVLYNFWENFK